MEVSSINSVSASSSRSSVSSESAKILDRMRGFAAAMSDESKPLAERLEAYTNMHRMRVKGDYYHDTPREELKFLEDAYRSPLAKEMQRVDEAWAKELYVASKEGRSTAAASLSHFDSLSADDQAILFATRNSPVYQDLSRMGRFEPTQPWNSVEEWRSMHVAMDAVFNYLRKVGDGENLSPAEQARRNQIVNLDQGPDAIRDGSWARQVQKLLAQPIDRVDISPEASGAMTQRAPAKLEIETPEVSSAEEIALMVLKDGQDNKEVEAAHDGEHARPSLTAERAQGSIVDISA